MIIDISGIMDMIPHRYPFLLVDKIIKIEAGKSITGIKNVTFNEPYFAGHFPDNPVMPGVLIVEAMAQVSALLVVNSTDIGLGSKENKDVYFMGIELAKFRKVVKPGDTLYLHANIEQNRGNVWKFSAKGEVEGNLVAESQFTAMVKKRD